MIDQYALQRIGERFQIKAALPVFPPWIQASFMQPTFENLTRYAYQRNSTFFACVSAYAFAFPEPPMRIYQDDEVLPDHPLRLLLRRPNPIMGEPEFWGYIAEWMAIGGNAYIYKVRNRSGRVVELWPYHANQIRPIPGGDTWIRGYEYTDGTGRWLPLPAEDIIHCKWPSIDPRQPWQAQPPLLAAGHETETANELTRFLNAALRNDAVPRTVIRVPIEGDVTPQHAQRMKKQFSDRYGAENVGMPVVVDQGAEISRLALDMQELAAPWLANYTDTAITKAMRVPPVIVATLAGVESSTYANYETARRVFVEDTLSVLWRLVAGEITSSLVPEFDPALEARFDMVGVQALRENEDAAHARLLADFQAGTLMMNEYRRLRGREDVPGGDVYYLPVNVYIAPTPSVLPLPVPDPEPEPEPEQRASVSTMPEYKTLHMPAEQKQRNERALRRIRERLERDARDYLTQQYRSAAQWIRENAPEAATRAAPSVDLYRHSGHSNETLLIADIPAHEYKADPPPWFAQLPLDMGDEISGILLRYYIPTMGLSYDDANELLNLDLAFDVENERVQDVLDLLATQVRRVAETTRAEIRALVGLQASEGWSVDDLAAEILKLGEIQTPNRARLIARTETARAYSEGSILAYQESVVVQRTEWLVTDPCPICEPLAGTTAPLGGEFAPGIRVPGDPHPACKCALAPIVEV